MKTIFFVSADHVSPKFRAERKAVDVHRDGTAERPRGFFADATPYGCGKTYRTAEEAVRGLLSDNGCTNIRIEG